MKLRTKTGIFTVGFVRGELICDFGSHNVDTEPTARIVKQLEAYFNGTFTEAFDAPLPHGPPFTRRCWEACRTIPYGTTITYAQLAKAAHSPKAVRAAGQAMRRNPTTIITPCHRVVAASGELHGFAGSTDPSGPELRRKQFLLTLERRTMHA